MLFPTLLCFLCCFAFSTSAQVLFTQDCSASSETCENYCFAAFCRGKVGPYTLDRGAGSVRNRRVAAGVRPSNGDGSPCTDNKQPPWSGPDARSKNCDEFPFATTTQGGAGAVLRCVPSPENSSQGQQLKQFYNGGGIQDGGTFNIATTNLQSPTSFCLPNPDCTQADAANEFTYVNGGYHVARRGMAMGSYEPVQNTTHIEAVRFLTSLGIEMTALAAKNSEHGIAVGSPIWHAEGVSSFVVEIL